MRIYWLEPGRQTEWTENKLVPVRMRSTTVNEEVSLKDLKKEIEVLTTNLKLTTF